MGLILRHSERVNHSQSVGHDMSPEVAAVCDELAAREPIYHHPHELGTTRVDFDAQTAEDFWEVGASGTVYQREQIWATLEQRYGDPDFRDEWEASGFHCRALGTDYYLLTYLLREGARVTRRATVWTRAAVGWQVVYHQGTLAESD